MASIYAVKINVINYRSSRKTWYEKRKSESRIDRVIALDSRDRAIMWRKSYFAELEKK